MIRVPAGERIVGVRTYGGLNFTRHERTQVINAAAGESYYFLINPGTDGTVISRIAPEAAKPLLADTTPLK